MDIGTSITEQVNDVSQDIDIKSSLEILQIMNNEDKKVACAITPILPAIARLIDRIVHALNNQGRMIYIGAGTSGRLGVLDASECPPTFGTAPDLVQGLIAGGPAALVHSVEDAEDDAKQAIFDLQNIEFSKCDVLIGISASGSASYAVAALRYASTCGAVTAAISCNTAAEILQVADYPLCVEVGPEIIAGSTRLKAGTAQKMLLNMLSTVSMIKLGKVYGNLMVDLKPANKKLEQRSLNLIKNITNCDERTARAFFQESGKQPKVAIAMLLSGKTRGEAETFLQSNPSLRQMVQGNENSRGQPRQRAFKS